MLYQFQQVKSFLSTVETCSSLNLINIILNQGIFVKKVALNLEVIKVIKSSVQLSVALYISELSPVEICGRREDVFQNLARFVAFLQVIP
jgi:hypothetical protein